MVVNCVLKMQLRAQDVRQRSLKSHELEDLTYMMGCDRDDRGNFKSSAPFAVVDRQLGHLRRIRQGVSLL